MKAELPKRRLIPRWTRRVLDRPLALTHVPVPLAEPSEEQLVERVEESKTDTSMGVLGDLISLAMFPTARAHLVEVAQGILDRRSDASEGMIALAELVASGQLRSRLDARTGGLASLRLVLRDAPDDVPALLDVAQLHAANGKVRAADRALAAAVQLAPQNRDVLRTRVRFLVHVGRPDEAHALLVKHPSVSSDPWLMASEIAVADSAAANPRLLGKARRLLLSSEAKDPLMGELAGAVAAVEIKGGNFKSARALYRRALTSGPTANLLAQVANDAPVIGLPIEHALFSSEERAYEAHVIEAYRTSDFGRAEGAAMMWHREEPFSSRPLLLLSFLSSCRGDAEVALKWTSLGLRGEPKDAALWGNQAYALAALNRLDEAQYSLDQCSRHDLKTHLPQVLATHGMILLRRGCYEEGTELYNRAILKLDELQKPQQGALCKAFFAREMSLLELSGREIALQQALEAANESGSVEAKFVLASIGALPASALEKPEASPVRWHYDSATNVLRLVDPRAADDEDAAKKRLARK